MFYFDWPQALLFRGWQRPAPNISLHKLIWWASVARTLRSYHRTALWPPIARSHRPTRVRTPPCAAIPSAPIFLVAGIR